MVMGSIGSYYCTRQNGHSSLRGTCHYLPSRWCVPTYLHTNKARVLVMIRSGGWPTLGGSIVLNLEARSILFSYVTREKGKRERTIRPDSVLLVDWILLSCLIDSRRLHASCPVGVLLMGDAVGGVPCPFAGGTVPPSHRFGLE